MRLDDDSDDDDDDDSDDAAADDSDNFDINLDILDCFYYSTSPTTPIPKPTSNLTIALNTTRYYY